MPRNKRAAKRLTAEDRARQQWEMGQQQEEKAEPEVVEVQDSDSDEDDWGKLAPPKRSKKAKSSPAKGAGPTAADRKGAAAERQNRLRQRTLKELEPMEEVAQLCVNVSLKDSSAIEDFVGTLGQFQFRLRDGEDWPDKDFLSEEEETFWVYLSEVPQMDFALFRRFVFDPASETPKDFAERRRRGRDPDDFAIRRLDDVDADTRRLLEAFGRPSFGGAGVSEKRRCCRLVLNAAPTDGGRFSVDAVTSDSLLLLHVDHPSTVPLPAPPCVRRTLNHFFGLASDDVDDEDVPVDVRPDIDELYEVVKRHHDINARELDPLDPQHVSLLPTLRPYQKLAVRWMLSKEKEGLLDQNDNLHVLFREVETREGVKLYYNALGGYLTKHKPKSQPVCPGGILADEMGLGKTVEVLSLMLCHHREGLVKPDWQEPIVLEDKSKKKRRRRREPSPVEFLLNTPDVEEKPKEEVVSEVQDKGATSLPEVQDDETSETEEIQDVGQAAGAQHTVEVAMTPDDAISQVDGNASDDSDSSDEEYVPRPSTSRKREKPGHTSSTSEEDSEEEEEEYVPRPSTSRSGGRSRRAAAEPTPEPQPETARQRKRKSVSFSDGASTSGGKKKAPSGTKLKSKKGILKKAKVINTEVKQFDPASVLSEKQVTNKSTMEEMVLFGVVQLTTDSSCKYKDGASVQAVKKFMATNFSKTSAQHQKLINKSLAKLVESGKLINTSGKGGSTGSFKVNPEHDSHDSRAAYADRYLTQMEQVIEDVITEHCYDGHAFNKEEAQAKLDKHMKPKKEPSTLQKLQKMYEKSLEEMSEACEASQAYRKARRKWNGTFFDTKVDQVDDYLECICGSELDAEYDSKYRVQCVDCRLWQHAECVKYDVSDPHRGDYCCPHCWTLRKPVPSGATLIVSPSSISYQWIEEIQKHIRHKNVRMLFYEGTKQAGYIQPRDLAQYDIVITTYGVLQSETNYVDLPHSNSAEGRRFRNPKRFMAIPAPLPCVEWWRVCLDEAQMIECAATKTAEMALRLAAVNRWCVTGTPIEKSLNDLQGLLLFLKVDPYSINHWWKRCLYSPFCRGNKKALEEVLCRLMWRTSKKDVLHQIEIPLQTEKVHWLSFSPIEEHFYRRQHIECSRDAAAKIRRMPDLAARLSSIDRNTLNGLLNPMLKLRQSCCHPQAVRGQFLNMQNKSSTAMTMEELLDQMVKKAVLECEDFHRQFIAALNGLAGIAIIEENWAEAAEKYREAIRVMEEYKKQIKTDTLQRLHTSTNLAEVLEAGHEGITPTLRDSALREECQELQTKYLSKYINASRAARESVHPTSQSIETIRSSFVCQPSSWYEVVVDAVSTSASAEHEDGLMDLVREELAQFYDVANDREFNEIKRKYPNARMVLYQVGQKVEEFDSTRDLVCRGMKELETSPPETFLNDAVDCHLRQIERGGAGRKTCRLCEVHENIELYENLIFKFVNSEISKLEQKHQRSAIITQDAEELDEKGVLLIDKLRRGTWADSEAERMLRAMLKFARSSSGQSMGLRQGVLDDGAAHMKLLDTMKKEFRQMRILWRQIYDHVAGVDELNMSIMRLRLRYEDEPQTSEGALKRKKKGEANVTSAWLKSREKIENIYILEQHELPGQKLKLVSERTVSQSEFRKKYGQLQYLENLKRSDYGKGGGGDNPEACPICQQGLGRQWSVLQCGHCYCVDCSETLIKQYSSVGGLGGRRSLKCPVCRSTTYHSEISYVNTRQVEELPVELADGASTSAKAEPEIEVKGSLSTKMEAVVRTILRIKREDPDAKSLVFSTWPDVLDIVASALLENDIPYAALHAQGKFKRNLQKFKNREDVKVLLLPISSGANGLNLIEASHVLLIEPILNPAQELQAIGRVHRIGQTKPTVVHKFVVKATIEERMFNILSSYKVTDESAQGSHSTEENVLTVRDLKNIFVDGDD